MSSLAQVPNETWLHVLCYLRLHLDPDTYPKNSIFPQPVEECVNLASVCRVSKRFLSLAQPLLYHTLPIADLQPDLYRLLLRTLSTCPDLGALAREATIVNPLKAGEGGLSSEILSEAFENARARLSLGPIFENRLRAHLKDVDLSQTYAAQTVFLLCLLPKLEVLETLMPLGEHGLLQSFFDPPRQPADATSTTAEASTWYMETRFPHLQDLRVENGYAECTAKITKIECLIRQSAIKRFRGFALSWDSDSTVPLGLEHLFLHQASVKNESFRNIVSRCPGLKTLKIVWCSQIRDPESYELDFTRIGEDLRKYATNLESLDLVPMKRRFSIGYDPSGKIGSLQVLTRLRRLSVPQNLLHWVPRAPDNDAVLFVQVNDDDADGQFEERLRLSEVLPDGLEHLGLYTCQHDEEALDDQIMELLSPERMSNLRYIKARRRTKFSRRVAGWEMRKTKNSLHMRKRIR